MIPNDNTLHVDNRYYLANEPLVFQGESQVSGAPGGPGGQGGRVSKRRSRSSGLSTLARSGSSGGRESPIGAEREREFPTTKIGASGGADSNRGTGPGGQMASSDSGGHSQASGGYQGGYHGHHGGHGGHGGRCSGAHGSNSSVAARSVITGDLVQSRDFHYSVEQTPVYRRPREVAAYPQSQSGGHSRSSRNADNYAYVEHKSSPYHTGTLRTSVRGLPDDSIQRSVRGEDGMRVRGGGDEGLRAGRLDQNYMMVRAQSRLQDGYERLSHRSDSRGDLLDSDHNTIYDHGLYYQPGQYSGFVRTCDGKFIRTNIPQHDFETLDTNFYRNSQQAPMHGTMRRPSKSRHQSHGGGAGDYCCPSREEPGGLRASDQLQQSYATLRGRKYTEKNCGARSGVGDNYGRNTLAPNFMDDARSVHSLADDFFLPQSGGRAGGSGDQQQQQSHAHLKNMSRSTDKSLDSLGLEDDTREMIPAQFSGLGGLAANLASLRSDEILATMLKREPPDGKEKPEPPKHQKLENNSRKNSKCDLLDTGGHSSGHGPQGEPGHPGHATLSKTESLSSAKRDSGGGQGLKDSGSNYLDTSNILTEEDLVSERLKDW